MKKTSFIFSLVVAAHMPALAKAQSLSDDLGTSDLPEVDVIFKCHQDAYTMEAAAGGLAGKLAESKDRVYGALLFPNDSQFAFVAAPYKVSGPAFFEQDGVKFACVTVQSVKSLAESGTTADATSNDAAAPTSDSAAPADAATNPALATPDVGATDPNVAPVELPAAALPDFSGVNDGNVLSPLDPNIGISNAEPLEPIDAAPAPVDAIPAADGTGIGSGVPSAGEQNAEPVLAPIVEDANTPIVVPAAAAPVAVPAPAAPAQEAPLAPINNTPDANVTVQDPVTVPVATESNSIPPALNANTPVTAPEPAAATPSVPAEEIPLAPISMKPDADVAAEHPANTPVQATPVATDSNNIFAQPIVEDANTPIVVPGDASEPNTTTIALPPIPNAPVAPFNTAPAATDPNIFDPNIAVTPVPAVPADSNNVVTVVQDANIVDATGVTPTAITPMLGIVTPAKDVVLPEGEPANADELNARRNAAFWANFDD